MKNLSKTDYSWWFYAYSQLWSSWKKQEGLVSKENIWWKTPGTIGSLVGGGDTAAGSPSSREFLRADPFLHSGKRQSAQSLDVDELFASLK